MVGALFNNGVCNVCRLPREEHTELEKDKCRGILYSSVSFGEARRKHWQGLLASAKFNTAKAGMKE